MMMALAIFFLKCRRRIKILCSQLVDGQTQSLENHVGFLIDNHPTPPHLGVLSTAIYKTAAMIEFRGLA